MKGNGRYAFYGALAGVVSTLVFTIVHDIFISNIWFMLWPMAAVVSLNGPPTALIDQAVLMTVLFTLGMAVVITLRYGRTLQHFLAVLLTCAVLVALLGLNVSAIGLVAIPNSALFVVAELFGLIVALNAVYAAIFVVLQWQRPAAVNLGKSQD